MQSTVVEPKKTVGEESDANPGIAGKDVVKGVEVVGNDLAQGAVDLGTAVENVANAVGSEIARAGSRFEGGSPQAPEVRTESLKPVTRGAATAAAPGFPPVAGPPKVAPAPAPAVPAGGTSAIVPPTVPVTTPTTPATE